MSKYTASTETIQSFLLGAAQPLEIKEWFTDLTDLEDVTVNNNPLFFYEGMLAKVVETGKVYRWMESPDGAIAGGYTYGTYSHDGIVYTGRTFNWVDVGNMVFIVPLGGTFPDVTAAPIGSVVINEFVDTDTFVGIFELQASSPNTWVEIMRTSNSVSYAWFKAQVQADDNDLGIHSDNTGGLDIGSDDAGFTSGNYEPLDDGVLSPQRLIRAYYEGSGGDYGTSKKFARGDHTHDYDDLSNLPEGFIDQATTLTNTEDLDDYKDYGIWYYLDTDLPTNGLNLSLGAGEYYQLRVSNMPNGDVVQEVWTREGGFQAKRNYDLGTTTWSAWDETWHIDYALLADMEAGTAVDKIVTPGAIGTYEVDGYTGPAITTDETSSLPAGQTITYTESANTYIKKNQIGSLKVMNLYLEFDAAYGSAITGFRIALNTDQTFKTGMEGTALGYDASDGYYQLRWKYVNSTPDKLEFYKLDGTAFRTSTTTYKFWLTHSTASI